MNQLVLSLFAGIGGFDLAFRRAGIEACAQVETDRQCNAVLARHFADTRRFGDVTGFRARLEPKHAERFAEKLSIQPDIIAGGFPCQDLSVAGRRAGLAGARSGFWFIFRRIIALLRPRWVLVENVPGLLSSNGARDLGTILRQLGQLGYGYAYRVLDAQWFGVPQRRKRVFIVGHFGDVHRAAEVLFERDCLPWDSPPRRTKGARVAASLTSGVGASSNDPGRRREDDVNLAYCLNAKGGSGRIDGESETFVSAPIDTSPWADREAEESRLVIAHTLRAEGHDAKGENLTRGVPFVFDERNVTSKANRSRIKPGRPCHTLHADAPTIALQSVNCPRERKQNGIGIDESGACYSLTERDRHGVLTTGVRRLTPRECERLQGFPDDWTRYGANGEEISDSARYRMLGNAVAVPVAEWIARRMAK